MVNRKPFAGDVYLPVFNINSDITGDVLENSYDSDGDAVRLNFVNGQRIPQPSDPDGPPTVTLIQGVYGMLSIQSNGVYTYTLDTDNPAVAALSPGEQIVEKFTFKISDGKGATDFGLFNIGIDLPERGPVFAGFEDVGALDFPTGYKGLDWGAWRDGDDAVVRQEANGNHYLQGGSFWTPIYSADGGEFQMNAFKVANGTDDYDNTLTVIGSKDGNDVFSETFLITADQLADAQTIDLSSYGEIDYLFLRTDPVDPENAGPDFFGARYDDFSFIV